MLLAVGRGSDRHRRNSDAADQRPGIAPDLMLARGYTQLYAFARDQGSRVFTVNGNIYGRAIGSRYGDICYGDKGRAVKKVSSGFVNGLVYASC